MGDLAVISAIPYRDPAAAFAPLADRALAVLLDSADHGTPQGRYAYIAADPFRVIRCTPHPWAVTVDGEARAGAPFDVLADELARFPWRPAGPVPFCGGAVGVFAYELGGVLEALPAPKAAPRTAPGAMTPDADMIVGLYDVIAAFDHLEKRAWVIASGFPETDPAARRARGARRGAWLAGLLAGEPPPIADALDGGAVWLPESPRTAHEARVAAAIRAIAAGDIYQANITQRFLAERPAHLSPFALYRKLRARSPAPFGAFLNGGGFHLLSASPERFLACDAAGRVETRPIKGTRPRGRTPAEDASHADALRASAKDRAENLMIVDLLRNDLARVCVPGSVAVPVLCGLETFASVHHLVSVVTGHLRTGLTAVDLLKAAFPGGSVTGAPKIRAMEIIHDLEPSPRGPYCGALAWLGFDGAMDSSIVIRTLVLNGRAVAAQAGGGIVADSVPALEYEESLAKAAPLLAVMGTL